MQKISTLTSPKPENIKWIPLFSKGPKISLIGVCVWMHSVSDVGTWFLAIFGPFSILRIIFEGKKWKIQKPEPKELFFTILYYNLAKFQVSRSFSSWLLLKNVKYQISRFKVSGPIFAKNWPVFAEYFLK